MPSQTLETIRSLLALLSGTGARELEVCDGALRVRITMQGHGATTAPTAPPPAPAMPEPPPPVASAPEPDAGTIIAAPMHGVFHHAPAPDAPPFVRIGDTVTKGQKLCIMEAMKVFTDLCAPQDGVVTAIHARNGQDVAAGQPLFTLEAAGRNAG